MALACQLIRDKDQQLRSRTHEPTTIHNMPIKIHLAHWIARRIDSRTRTQRRALRDYQRQELRQIFSLEKRSRGLRLYAAWSRPRKANVVQTTASDWHSALPQAA